MSQLELFQDTEVVSSTPQTNEPVSTAPPNNTKAASKCRDAAAALEKHIGAKHESANRMLALSPTRKRVQDARSQRQEAMRLERIQRTLLMLADMHEAGTITPGLSAITTRATLERALFQSSATSEIRSIYDRSESNETTMQLAVRLEREAMLMKIAGFFPTPATVAAELVRFAALDRPRSILEPSAGSGSLMDAVIKQHPGACISYCEINCLLLDVLRAKYANSKTIHFVGRDFLELDAATFEPRFDGIVLNPPFENREDIDHVCRAYKLLSPNGVLAAIMSEGTFSRTDKKTAAFRDFLEESRAEVIGLPAGAFAMSGTGVSCRMIRIEEN